MSQNNKIIIFTVLCLISISVLTGCQNNTQIQTNIESSNSYSSLNDTNTYSTQIQKTTLVLNQHGCIGCGICTQVAPDNFSMRGRKAVVTSQKNITTSQVNMAIENCPTSVIEIIET